MCNYGKLNHGQQTKEIIHQQCRNSKVTPSYTERYKYRNQIKSPLFGLLLTGSGGTSKVQIRNENPEECTSVAFFGRGYVRMNGRDMWSASITYYFRLYGCLSEHMTHFLKSARGIPFICAY